MASIYFRLRFTDNSGMGMVDRYKKSGGFVQLIQVIETCNLKKREQFMNIISEENPGWAEALVQKSITFEKIVGWKVEVILDVIATVNILSFSAALKSLSKEQLELFLQKLSHQDRKKFEVSLHESNPSPNEISASIVKIISETRNLLIQGALKADKIDPNLVIPEDYESLLDKNTQGKGINTSLNFEGSSSGFGSSDSLNSEFDKIQKKIMSLTKEVQTLKQENQVMKDKLDKIKKIA